MKVLKMYSVVFSKFKGISLWPLIVVCFLNFQLSLSARNSETSSLNLIKLLNSVKQDKPQARQQIPGMDFLGDPALLVTILHSLEIAYWSLPFGFVLSPIINFFRIPNRRRSEADYTRPINHPLFDRFNSPEVDKILQRFNQALRKFDTRSKVSNQ